MISHKCFAKGAEGHTLYNDAYDAFYAGKGAMFLGNGILSEIAPGEKALGKNFDLFRFPTVPDSKRPPLSDAGAFAGWALTSFSKHQPEAWKYIAFLLSPSAQETAWKVGNLVPNNVVSKVTTTSPGMKKVFQLAKNREQLDELLHLDAVGLRHGPQVRAAVLDRRRVYQPDPRPARAGSHPAAAAS